MTSGRDKTARLWNVSDAAQEPAKRCDWSIPYISTHAAMSTSWHVADGPRDPADTACGTRPRELSRGYEVEFSDDEGKTYAELALAPD